MSPTNPLGLPNSHRTFWQRWGVAVVGMICVVLSTAALIFTYLTTDHLNQRLTPLEQAPCRLNPGGKECAQAIDGILQTITPYQARELQRRAQR